MPDSPTLLSGGLSVDDRGQVSFCNDFDFATVRRFYLVSNHRPGLVRAWHGHKADEKAVTVISGSAIVAAVRIDDWDHPDPTAKVHRFVLSASQPAVLLIPAGWANGFATLTGDARLLWFSSLTLAESQRDDYRFEPYYWNPWGVEER